MRIALVQQKAGHDKNENLSRGIKALEHAAEKGAEIICFAELAFERFYPQFRADKGFENKAEPVPGPVTEIFGSKAKELGVVVVLNLFERDGDKCYDCSPVIDSDGTLLGKTRMIHITDYDQFHEKGYYWPGDTGTPVYETKAGKIGVAICYDRHYPEYMRSLALNGAEIVFIPQAGSVGEWPEGLYESEVRVASFQNGYFAALCNRVGIEDRLEFAGESFVCSPHGVVLARAGAGTEEILLADLNMEEIPNCAAKRLFLKDRRPELYHGWLGKKRGY